MMISRFEAIGLLPDFPIDSERRFAALRYKGDKKGCRKFTTTCQQILLWLSQTDQVIFGKKSTYGWVLLIGGIYVKLDKKKAERFTHKYHSGEYSHYA